MAEIAVESAALHRGMDAMAIGATTGVVEFKVEDMRVNLEQAEVAPKGIRCSVAVSERLRRGDKIYIWEEL